MDFTGWDDRHSAVNVHYFSRRGENDPIGDSESTRATASVTTVQTAATQSIGGRTTWQTLEGRTYT